jgi:hypothetical protein
LAVKLSFAGRIADGGADRKQPSTRFTGRRYVERDKNLRYDRAAIEYRVASSASPMANQTMTFDVVREIALALPGVMEGNLHGAPSLKVGGKLLACPALHRSAEAGTMVVKTDFEQRARLLTEEPHTYYLTDHYAKQPVVLVRLSRIRRDAMTDLLGTAWRLLTSMPEKTSSRGRNQAGGAAK